MKQIQGIFHIQQDVMFIIFISLLIILLFMYLVFRFAVKKFHHINLFVAVLCFVSSSVSFLILKQHDWSIFLYQGGLINFTYFCYCDLKEAKS